MAEDSRRPLWPGLMWLAGSVVLGSLVLWWSRAQALGTGLPCDARGWLGCSLDGRLFLAVGLLAGGVVLSVTAATAWVLRRRGMPRPRLVVWAGLAVWLTLFGFLLVGTRGTH